MADKRTGVPLAHGEVSGSAVEVAAVEVAINGELGPGAVPRARTQLDRVLALRPRQVVIDLAGCPFLDAAAIAFLLEAHRRLWRTDGRLSLRSPSPRVRRMLRTARVDGVLDISPPPGADPQDGRPLDQLPLCAEVETSRRG
jgi:anti-anti-sigma factor